MLVVLSSEPDEVSEPVSALESLLELESPPVELDSLSSEVPVLAVDELLLLELELALELVDEVLLELEWELLALEEVALLVELELLLDVEVGELEVAVEELPAPLVEDVSVELVFGDTAIPSPESVEQAMTEHKLRAIADEPSEREILREDMAGSTNKAGHAESFRFPTWHYRFPRLSLR